MEEARQHSAVGMIPRSSVAFGALVLLLSCPNNGQSAPVAMSCEFIDGTKGGTYAASVDHLMLDEEKQGLEFSVARSIGTTNPINYRFANSGKDRLVMYRTGDALLAAGVRFDSPFAIRVDEKSGTVVWQYIDGALAEYSRYRCAR
jgi:hypothetical protein